MSFTYLRNGKGSTMDPCDTPNVKLEESEQQSSKCTLNNCFERYDLNQPIVWLKKPIALNFFQ